MLVKQQLDLNNTQTDREMERMKREKKTIQRQIPIKTPMCRSDIVFLIGHFPRSEMFPYRNKSQENSLLHPPILINQNEA